MITQRFIHRNGKFFINGAITICLVYAIVESFACDFFGQALDGLVPNFWLQELVTTALLVVASFLKSRRVWAWVATLVVLILSTGIRVYDICAHDDMTIYQIGMAALQTVCAVILIAFNKVFVQKAASNKEIERARELVNKYGQNTGSYIALEGDKDLYFGTVVEGVIAYLVIGNIVMVQGDPICAPENFTGLMAEFKSSYSKRGLKCIIQNTTEKYLDEYKQLGFEAIKFGEEARISLADYTISGGKMQKLRADVNHATKAGVTVREYKVAKARDKRIDAEIERISAEWLSDKGSTRLGFSVGDVNLHNPMDRRYFVAEAPVEAVEYDENGKVTKEADPDGERKVVGFHVFIPFAEGRGYLAEVTRRSNDAPGGTTEKLNFEAFEQFKDEGCEWASLGISPLSNIEDENNSSKVAEKVLKFIYKNGGRIYGFHSLHRTKVKYQPTSWEPAYLVYSKGSLDLDGAMAILKAQNPGGVVGYLRGFLKK